MRHPGTVLLKHAIIIVTVLIAVVSADYLGLFLRFDYACYDMFFRLRGPAEPDRRILIAAVDERTLNRLGRWPLKRIYYTRLLEALGKADVIGFDIVMNEPSEDDALLSRTVLRHGAVVFPSYQKLSAGALDSSAAISPRLTGHVHMEQDIDGAVRRIFHTIVFNGNKIPSFSSAIYQALTGKPIRGTGTGSGDGKLPAGSVISQRDPQTINYYGPPGTFPIISMADIIDGRYPADYFIHRIILVGATAEGVDTGVLTPFSQDRNRMSGIETHANIFNNLIHGNSIKEAPDPARWIVSVCLSLLGLLLFFRTGNRWMLLSWLMGIIGVTLASFVLFSRLDYWFSPVLFGLSLSFLLIYSHFFKLELAGLELQAAKEDWEESFNTINDAIVLMDCGGFVTRSNKAAVLLPERVLSFLSARSLELGGTGHTGNGDEKVPAKTVETQDPDSRRFYEIKSLPRFDGKDEKIGFVHIVQDISDRKQAEEEKELMRFQLLQSQKMESVGRMAAGITHDFNNLLTAILGFSELAMIKMPRDDPMRGHIQIIHESGLKAAQLTRQLLAFSRKQVMDIQVVNLGKIANDLSKILARLIGEDVTLKLVTDTPTSCIKADPGHLEQVIINLAVNARDAMPHGGTLTIETSDVFLDENYARNHFGVAPGHYVTLRMTDTGIGMSPEVQTKIFEPFFTTKKAGEGTGLGLSTVYGIIKQLSGHIHVYSEVGTGSVFTIYMPACQEGEEKSLDQSARTPRHGSESFLVAEDDPMIRQLIADTLVPLGYKVSLASSCEEAVSIMEAAVTDFDLLLTDVIMPESGGKELAQAFQKRYPSARVIFMSGYTDEIIARHGLEPEGIAFIQKPLIPNRLLMKLREVLDGPAP